MSVPGADIVISNTHSDVPSVGCKMPYSAWVVNTAVRKRTLVQAMGRGDLSVLDYDMTLQCSIIVGIGLR